MDKSIINWNLVRAKKLFYLNNHDGEVISVSFNSDGDKILTRSFYYTA